MNNAGSSTINPPLLSDYGLTDEIIKQINSRNNLRLGIYLIGCLFIIISNIEFTTKLLMIAALWSILSITIGHKKRSQLKKYLGDKKKFDEWFILQQESFWRSLSPRDFEIQIAELYKKLGYKTEVSQYTVDGGHDVKIEKDGYVILVQCKHWKHKVPVPVIREILGVIISEGAHAGIVACTGGFTAPSIEFARKNGIELVGIPQIIEIAQNALY
jgi:HJR/Mrr/RecB family endonuclease